MKTSLLLSATVTLVLLTACESTDSNIAFDRAQGRDTYATDLRTMQARGSMVNGGGITPIAGWQVGSGTNGVQPFSNPNALYSIPQSR